MSERELHSIKIEMRFLLGDKNTARRPFSSNSHKKLFAANVLDSFDSVNKTNFKSSQRNLFLLLYVPFKSIFQQSRF